MNFKKDILVKEDENTNNRYGHNKLKIFKIS